MQVTETLSEGLKRGFTIVVPAADIETRRTARLTDLGRTLRLPGFRPGKVPLPVVRQRYGTAVTAEVLEESVSRATQQVLTERGLRPAVQPKVDLISKDVGMGAASDLTFSVELELLPEIELPDFGTIMLTRLKAEAGDETVDKALQDIAKRNPTYEDIAPEDLGDRGVAKGEVVVVDYIGRIDGEEFTGSSAKDAAVEVGGDGFIPGFTDQLEGVRPGETRTIDVTFPDPYMAAHLAGKPAQFEVAAKKIQRLVPTPVDDALAQKMGIASVDELRRTLTRRVQSEYDQLARLRLKRELLDRLAELVTFAVPQSMVDTEFDQIWQRIDADRKEGRQDDDDKGKDEDTLKAEYRAIAERRVRLGLLLAEIGRANNVTVSPDEMMRAIQIEASRYPGQETAVIEYFRKNPRQADSLRGPIFEDKVIDFVLELAKTTDQIVSPEDLAKDPAVA
ncbi:MAG TPA: trigger factor [Acetobacteraceae bacterium]|nr:trigger factor [Acetobacteraceae bacterium]